MEQTYGTVMNSFTAASGEQGYELSFSDGDEGSYLAREIRVTTPIDQELNEALDDLASTGMLYHRGAHAPDWWDVLKKHARESEIILESATMGSSANNEWYAFRDRAAAVSHIRSMFDRQAFVDNYTYLDEAAEFYRTDELEATETDDGEIVYTIPKGVKPASIGEMIACESRF